MIATNDSSRSWSEPREIQRAKPPLFLSLSLSLALPPHVVYYTRTLLLGALGASWCEITDVCCWLPCERRQD